MEALAAFSVACNVFQVLDFSLTVLKGVLYLAQPGEDSLPEHASASALATDLQALTARIQTQSIPSFINSQLKTLCDRCDQVAQELITILNSLKATKRRQLVWKAIRSQLEKERIALLEQRIDSYRSEIQLYITIELSTQIDAQTAQQSDGFKALSKSTQDNLLTVLKAIGDGNTLINNQITQQTATIQSLHEDAKQTTQTEAERVRQVLLAESEQSRLQVITTVQNGISKSEAAMTAQLWDSTDEVVAAQEAMEGLLTGLIKSSEQKIQEDIDRVSASVLFVYQKVSSTEAMLRRVISELERTKKDEEQRKELQREGSRLTELLVALRLWYQELRIILANLLDQARSMFDPIRFQELFKQQIEEPVELVDLSSKPQHPRVEQQSLGRIFPYISTPEISFSNPGLHFINMRVALMKPIKATNTHKPPSHHRALSAPPTTKAARHLARRHEEINTDIVTIYYQYCYVPFFPPPGSLLSADWKHREHKLPNPLEEYKKNIRRQSMLIGEEAAVIELARRGDEFVWFMALIVAVVEACVERQRAVRIIRAVFSIVLDWVEEIKAKGEGHTSFQVALGDMSKLSQGFLQICQQQDGDDVPGYVGKFDQKTLLGRRIENDIALWTKVAERSGLSTEAKDLIEAETGNTTTKHAGRLSPSPYAASPSNIVRNKDTVQDAQIVFLLVHTLMVSRVNMVAIIEAEADAGHHNFPNPAQQQQVAFPVTRPPGSPIWMFDIPSKSTAFVVANALATLGIRGLQSENKGSQQYKIRDAFQIAKGLLPPAPSESTRTSRTPSVREAEEDEERSGGENSAEKSKNVSAVVKDGTIVSIRSKREEVNDISVMTEVDLS